MATPYTQKPAEDENVKVCSARASRLQTSPERTCQRGGHPATSAQGADCHDVDDAHWINGNLPNKIVPDLSDEMYPIANPMSGYPEYATCVFSQRHGGA